MAILLADNQNKNIANYTFYFRKRKNGYQTQ